MNVVAPESGTVAAPPESESSLKLPSGEVIEQVETPLVFQNTDVRVPSDTLSGTAQISTCGGTVGACGCGAGAGAGAGAGGVACFSTTGTEGGAGEPT